MSSFGESKTKKLLEEAESAEKLVEYNCKQISRIYPGAKRQDSSNLKVSLLLMNFDPGKRFANIFEGDGTLDCRLSDCGSELPGFVIDFML